MNKIKLISRENNRLYYCKMILALIFTYSFILLYYLQTNGFFAYLFLPYIYFVLYIYTYIYLFI